MGKWPANKPEGNNTRFQGRRTPAEGQPTSQKGTIQDFGEGGHRPKADQQARSEQYKIIWKKNASHKAEGSNTTFLGRGTPAEVQPTSQKGTIQNFWEGGCQPKAGQQAIREQYKLSGKENTGRLLANKPEGNNTKILGRRTPAKGWPILHEGTIQNLNNTKFWGGRTQAEGQPTSQKGTIQNFWEI